VGVAIALMPRHFTPGEQRQITAWEVSGRWRGMAAGQIFPSLVEYSLPSNIIQGYSPLSLQAVRVAIAPESACAAAVTDQAAATVLRRNGCQALLRATYIDQTSSFVVTVGVAVLPTPTAAATASTDMSSTRLAVQHATNPLPSGVLRVHFTGAAGGLYDYYRQLAAALPAGPYLVLYSAGYSDNRPRVQLARDSYSQAEMSSMAQGVAHLVADDLDAPPPTPHCPGGPGC
jgi:hypothetical protein